MITGEEGVFRAGVTDFSRLIENRQKKQLLVF